MAEYNPGILAKNITIPTRELDPEKETAIGQLPGILAKDNPLQQQAVTRAKQSWNARGLLPSSMAVQAGEEAAIGAAMPLATEAAGAYRGQAAANQGLLGQSALNLQQIQAGKEAGAENFGYSTQLNQQQIEAQKEAAKSGFGYQTQLTQQQIEANKAAAAAGFGYSTQLTQQQIEANKAAQQAGFGYSKELNQQQIEAQKSAQQTGFEQTLQLTDKQQANQEKLLSIQQTHQETMANLDQENKLALASIEKEHQLTLQNNVSAVNMYNQTMQAISQIASNPDLSPEQQNAGKNKQLEMLGSGLKLIGSIPPDAIDWTGRMPGEAESTPTVQSTGGMAPGQTPPPGSGNLSPGSFLGQIKTFPKFDRWGNNAGEYRVQWTPEGWANA